MSNCPRPTSCSPSSAFRSVRRTPFPHLWEQIRTAVKPGGFFVGQFLGPNDDWAGGACLSHGMHDIELLLDEWAILDVSEEEHDGVAGAQREPKYWHIIAVIARRP